MNLQTEKFRIIQLLLNTDNPSIIEKINSIFHSSGEHKDIWDELTDDQKSQVETALAESINNLTVDYDSFMEQHR